LQFALMATLVAVGISIIISVLGEGRHGWQWPELRCACAFFFAVALSLTIDLLRRPRAAQKCSSESDSEPTIA
jgi:Na+/melibiose symporter-like transporter